MDVINIIRMIIFFILDFIYLKINDIQDFTGIFLFDF